MRCIKHIIKTFLFMQALMYAGCRALETKDNGIQYKWTYVEPNDEIVIYSSSGKRIGVAKMTKNTRYCKPIEEGKKLEYAPVILPPKPSAPTEYEYNEAGWFRNEVQPAQPPEGKIVSSVTYVYDPLKNAVVAQYEYEDAPKPVRVFSKLKLYAALTQAGLWDSFEAWLKTQEINGINAYTAFSLAQDLNDSNELFNGVVESAKTALGVSDEVVEMILEASILDYM